MTRDFFEEQIKRLGRVYGERSYPTERVAMIWRKVGHYHERIIEEALDALIAESAQAPMLSKIREAVYAAQKLFPHLSSDPFAELRDKLRSGQGDQHQCGKCWNHGIIDCYLKGEPVPYREQLICQCRWGELAHKLPENKRMSRWLHYYDHYYVLDTQSDSMEILEKFKNMDVGTPQAKVMAIVSGAIKAIE